MLDERSYAVIKIRAKLLRAARHWLDQNDYVEVHGPTIIPAFGEWPGYFEVRYFDKKAYLSQGLQPYANAFMVNFGKIYTVAPVFRAEKLITKRHLTEFWRVEIAQKCDLTRMIEVQEGLIAHICHSLSKEAIAELEFLNRDVKNLADIKLPFPRLTYDEAIELLQADGFNVLWGQQIDSDSEKHLTCKFKQPFFITMFPSSIQTFFYKSHDEKTGLTLSVDLMAPAGGGEISGGGQMIEDKDVIVQKMKEEKIEPTDQQWYLSLFQEGSFPRSGFAIGIERLIQWICNLDNIEDAIAFPRVFGNIYP